MRFDGEEAGAEALREILRHDRARAHGDLLDRSLDRQPVTVDRLDVVRVGIAEEDVVAVARKPRADGAADRSRSDHDVLHAADAGKGESRPPHCRH